MATFLIVNPLAGSGRAGEMWSDLEPLARAAFGDIQVAMPSTSKDLLEQLMLARKTGFKRFIAVGGDGTMHMVLNALLEAQEQQAFMSPIILGQLPIGTGQDFARVLNIPRTPQEALPWLAHAEAYPIDVGEIQLDQHRRHFFMNIASAGVSGAVDERVNRIQNRRPWTFWLASIQSFMSFRPPTIRLMLDGQPQYEGQAWLVAVANGTTFGKGMKIAPNASVNDGWLDVILVKSAARLKMLKAFNSVYKGEHLNSPYVESFRARDVLIQALDDELLLDLDGEADHGRSLVFGIRHHALDMLYRKP